MKKRILSMILALAMVLSLGLSVFAEGEETQADIVDAAFALATGASLEGNKTLTGEVSQIITEYSSEFDNVSVNIIVLDGQGAERTLLCYRMKGDDAATVEVGDTITVTGIIKNYKGTVEFDSGCTFVTVSKAGGDYAIKTFAGYAPGDVAILVRQEGKTTVSDVTGGKDYNAYALIVCNADGKVIDLDLRGPGRPAGVKGDYEIPADGFIIGINRDVSGYPIHVGSVDGSEAFIADGVELGSRIKLYGIDLAALADTAAQTVLAEGASFSIFPRLPETEEEILAAAFALEPGEVLEGTYSLTGVVTEKIDNNRQVKITVADHEILCFKMVEADYNAISVDDTVTVTGVLKNYQGTVEFDTGCTAVIVPMPLFDWDEDAWVDAVIGENAGWQNPDYAPADDADPETVLAPKFQYRIEDGYFYAAALFNLPLTKGTGNGNSTFFRVWVKTAEDQLSYRYFYEVYVKTDDTLGFRAADNINGTTAGTNSPTNNTESAYSYNMIETADGVLAEIRIPLEEIGATDYLAAYLTASIEKVTGGAVQNQCLYFPALGDAHITSGTWTEEHGNIGLLLIEPVEEPEPYEATVIVADNAILTDGETGFQGAWGTVGTGDVLLVSNPQCTTVPMIVTIIDELDEITEISKVILDLYHDANVMIGYPEGKAAVSVSADGETYTDIGEFDLVAADLGTGNHGTVSNVFEFEATEAKFVKIVLNVGSNAAVLGDSPADGKVNWEFISIAEITVEEAEELPEGAVAITHFANYGTNVSSVFFRIGEAKTIGEISAITYGESKTFAWSNAVVVDAEGKIINIVPSAEDADKTNLEVPEGGFIITGHGSSAAASAINGVVLGGTITLVNVDEAALVAGETAVELTNAAFVYTEPEVERPISYQKPYTVAKANGAATYWSNTAGTVTLDDDGVIITDGKYGSLAGDTKGNYVALNGLREKINDEFTYYAGIFVVDLGESYYVDKFDVHTAAQTGRGISQAKYIVVSYSTDGENFTQAGVIEGDGEIFNGTGSGWTAYYQELQLDESVSARYVKFEVTTWTQFLWIAEVEVWEGEEPEPMGDTTIDGVFDDDIWADVEWTTYDGYTKGTWQQYQKKGTYTYKTALAEDDDYIYFAGEVSCLNVTQIRLWFRTNPEASLYTHFVDVFSDGRHFIKKNNSLTENSPTQIENLPEYALIEDGGKTYVEIKVAKSDLDMDGDYDFIPQASVDGFSNLLGAEIIHGNFVFGGATMTYFPWVGWPAAPEETYVGLIPVTNHWIFTDITSGDTVGVINRAHYERQEDGSLRFVVGGTDLYPLVTYYYEEAKVYNVARGTLNYKFTTDRHNTNITFIFEDANGAPYSFPLANSAAGFAEGQYNAGTGDILPGTYEGSIALADLVASTSLYGNNPFPEADATELKFTGIQIYACGITDPAGGVYIDDLSVTVEASEPITEKIFDLEAEKVVGTITFTAEDPTLETIRISGSIDGEEYYDLNSNGNVAVADGVATLNIASKGYIKVRYIKVEGTNVNGTLELEEPAVPDDAVVVPPAGPYPMTGLNGAGYGIAYFTAEDAPEGFGLNAQDVFYSNDKPIKLNSAIITIAQKVDEGVYQILWNDCNGWSKETDAAHFNTPEGVEGIDYHDDKVFLAEDQIVFVIMSSGGYATGNDGVYSTGKWILRGLVAGNYLRLTEDTAELFINQPAAVASQEELSIADFDQDGDIDSDDAIYLLRAVLFPEDYEITLATPFYGDRNPTSDDAIYLLRHVLFPKDYPIPKE
ncbi:MAG: discoidin domain-containing protein [Clostridia bacterium]|nr:discoidin domain-containing protein [Clostridia bacterium]